MTKRALFVGRFCPFHNGHLAIMKKKIEENIPLLVLVRDTHYDLYPAELRKRMVEACMANLKVDAKVEIVDDIESLNYGRDVGYEVNEIDVPNDTKQISATSLRESIEKGDNSWREMVPKGTDKVLEDYLFKKGIVVWFTGLPCSGKSTIANAVFDILKKKDMMVERLDGDILRSTITKDLGFSKEDRMENLRRATFLAKLLARNGVIVLSSFITPYESIRKNVRNELEKDSAFIEVYVKASLETCKKRDEKGMYVKAEKGEIKNFTGINDPFEEPKNADIVLDTEEKTVNECVKEVINFLNPILRK
tara:strand:+ start:3593 stop:4513 length:921 start_codon:yes stop_codon:yes gene_type:complete